MCVAMYEMWGTGCSGGVVGAPLSPLTWSAAEYLNWAWLLRMPCKDRKPFLFSQAPGVETLINESTTFNSDLCIVGPTRIQTVLLMCS